MVLHKIRFYGTVGTIYLLTLGTIGGLLYSSHLFGTPVWAVAKSQTVHHHAVISAPKIISGIPSRIVIPTADIDLAVDKGYYDSATKTWSLSPDHAQFAAITSPANDRSGMTFIYGHGTDAVFGKIGTNRPAIGTLVKLYTANGHIFTYSLSDVSDLKPNETSILKDSKKGPPMLIIQTCTGVFSEWRTMFTFVLEKVE
jgi:LPXTG-site transpeptidase (sortase) family protein